MNDTCTWTQDSSGELYATECGKSFHFVEQVLSESDFMFCPYCGKTLIDVPYIEEDEE